MSISGFRSSALTFCAAAIAFAGCGGGPAPGPWQGAPTAHLDGRGEPAKVSPAYGVIYSFQGPPADGWKPYSSLDTYKGSLYGTTASGGSTNNGTVFAIALGSGQESQLCGTTGQPKVCSFGGAGDGADPKAGVNIVNGVVYGTTTGSASTNGTVYAILSGAPTTLYEFKGGNDGAVPTAGLTYLTSAGTFYSTTASGGTYGQGTVFEVTSSGYEKVLYSFKGYTYGDGATPISSLQNVDGTLYGTTEYGGKYNKGTLYLYNVSSSSAAQLVYSFGSYSGDAEFPESAVTSGPKGTLFGTTEDGGKYGKGTVYELSSNKVKIVYSFHGNPDGAFPLGGLLYRQGALYGTTSGGGSRGQGTVYKIVIATGKETVLHYFPASSKDGRVPVRRLSYENGMLYGTTKSGGTGTCPGTSGCGTVFAISP